MDHIYIYIYIYIDRTLGGKRCCLTASFLIFGALIDSDNLYFCWVGKLQ